MTDTVSHGKRRDGVVTVVGRVSCEGIGQTGRLRVSRSRNRQREGEAAGRRVLVMIPGSPDSKRSGRHDEPARGIDNGNARPQADAVLLLASGIDRSEWNEEW